jgi:hypothetical protein
MDVADLGAAGSEKHPQRSAYRTTHRWVDTVVLYSNVNEDGTSALFFPPSA